MVKHRLITDTDPANFDQRLKEELIAIDEEGGKILNTQFATSTASKETAPEMETVYSALVIYQVR